MDLMTSRAQEVLREALALPADERADVAAELVASLDEAPPEDPAEVEAAWAGARIGSSPGSFEGARRAALLYSIVQSCKLVDVPPFAYLKDVLLRVATYPHGLIAQLTPRGWAETFGRTAIA
jgi:hypothetical protein